jgi:hypothetical protein
VEPGGRESARRIARFASANTQRAGAQFVCSGTLEGGDLMIGKRALAEQVGELARDYRASTENCAICSACAPMRWWVRTMTCRD